MVVSIQSHSFMNNVTSINNVFLGGENLTKKTDEESTVKYRKTSESEKSGNAIDFNSVTETVGKVRDAIMTVRDSDIGIKNWHFSVDKIGEEYEVDFTIKLTVSPKTLSSSETEMAVE